MMNFIRNVSTFLENIIWLNIRRYRLLSFWRIIFFVINFMLFIITVMTVPQNILFYIFIIVTLSNMLFIYSRINSHTDSYILLRQLGASFIFIIFDNIIEIFIVFTFSVVFFLLLFFFIRINMISIMFILYQALVVILFIPAASLIVLINLDRQIRKE